MLITQYKSLIGSHKVQYIDSILQIDKQSNDYAWSEKSWLNAFNNKQYLIEALLIEDNLIGISVWLKLDIAYELLHIVIHKDYQNQGLATNWLNYMCDKFSQQNYEIWLEVRQSNITAQKLYNKCGFKTVSKRKNYYPVYINNTIINREDALLMQK